MDDIDTTDHDASVAQVVAVELAKSIAITAVVAACYYGSGFAQKKFREFKASRATKAETPTDN